MKWQNWISGYHTVFKKRMLVICGGNEILVQEFNKGHFNEFEKAVSGFERNSFRLEQGQVEMY